LLTRQQPNKLREEVAVESVVDARTDVFDMTMESANADASLPVDARVASAAEFERMAMPCLDDVARFARSLARDATRADDLVQETYLQALRGWHTFRPGADIKRWLLAVCHHAFVRHAQREARYVEAPEDDPELESMATAIAHRVAMDDGIGAIIDRMDLGPALDRAMATLPEHFRGAVVLVDVEGQSYEDAAGILGVAIGTVRSRLFRGRRLLQDLLFEHARDAGFPTTRASSVSAPPHSLKNATTGNPPAKADAS
jgi:RNA polymerase sigma-70 factor (ECF subfamily)